ncbi:MAG: carboxypeptidase regulatory-like domain-containing protein [Gemmatimonadaceae bacterium]|nr:carboxypeptidase regulatory-like domain-containing protein [Gemmatimonadaceae bacterium]
MPYRRSAALAAHTLLLAALAFARPAAAQRVAPPDTGAVSVTGVVYDSISARPLADAIVQFVARDSGRQVYTARTDSSGAYQLSGIRPGTYLAGFFHPAIDSLGIDAPMWAVQLSGDSTTHVNLATWAPVTLRGKLCHVTDPNDSTALVLGFVHDADTGAPLPNASVVVLWREIVIDANGLHQDRRQVPVKANESGWYAVCGIPTDAPVTARAELGARATGYIELSAPARGVLHQDFGIPSESAAVVVAADTALHDIEPTRRGTAQLTGIVRNPEGKPLNGAQVVLWGTTATANTNDDGRFALTNLPAGTQALEVRYVGFVPKRVTVDLSSGHTTSVVVVLDQRVTALQAVQVFGKRSARSRDLTGFAERMQRGFGHFITAADIEQRHPFELTDLLYTVPGVRVTPNGPFGHAIRMRGNCQPAVYVDHVPLPPELAGDLDSYVTVDNVVGIEVYNGESEIPMEFSSPPACGAIVIWTGMRPRTTSKRED